jgi:hypothetical protein
LSNVEFDLNGGCWLWNGAMPKGTQQRGFLTVDGRSRLASRISFQVFNGVEPGSGLVCHKCDVSACVNPDHLYLGDHAANMADMVSRRRYFAAVDPHGCREAGKKGGVMNTWSQGSQNPTVKLTPEQAAQIKSDTRKTKVIAEEYGVHRTTIQRIRRGALWN